MNKIEGNMLYLLGLIGDLTSSLAKYIFHFLKAKILGMRTQVTLALAKTFVASCQDLNHAHYV
jgi:hypothetical protein